MSAFSLSACFRAIRKAGTAVPARATAWVRLFFALALSLALHGLVLANVKAVSAQVPGYTYIEARLNPVVPAGPEQRRPVAPASLEIDAMPKDSAETAAAITGREAPSDPDPIQKNPDQPEQHPGKVVDHSNALLAMDLPLRYYDAMEVDKRAEPLIPVPLRLPQFALHSQSPGKVVLLLLISETGNVDRIEVLESQPRDIFDNSARTAFSMIPFSPAIRNGFPVRSRKIVEINYAPVEQ